MSNKKQIVFWLMWFVICWALITYVEMSKASAVDLGASGGGSGGFGFESNVVPTLHPFTPTPTKTATATPTKTPFPVGTVTLIPLPTKTPKPTSTHIPGKDCTASIDQCKQFLSYVENNKFGG